MWPRPCQISSLRCWIPSSVEKAWASIWFWLPNAQPECSRTTSNPPPVSVLYCASARTTKWPNENADENSLPNSRAAMIALRPADLAEAMRASVTATWSAFSRLCQPATPRSPTDN